MDYGYGDAQPDNEYSVGLNDSTRDKSSFRRRTPGRTASNESMVSVATADSYGEYQAAPKCDNEENDCFCGTHGESLAF